MCEGDLQAPWSGRWCQLRTNVTKEGFASVEAQTGREGERANSFRVIH